MLLRIFFLCISSLFLISCNNASKNRVTSFGSILVEKSGQFNKTSTNTGQILVFHLEASQNHKNDTGQIGVDSYSVTINEPHTREYCLKNTEGVQHRYTIEDEKGTVLLDISQGCDTINLTQGLYTHKIYNGTISADKTHTVFIYPSLQNTLNTSTLKKTEFKTFNRNTTQTEKQTYASIQETDLFKHTTVSFNACRGCNLDNVDLSKLAFDSQFEGNYLDPRMKKQYFESLNTNEVDFFATQNDDIDTYKVAPLNLAEASLKNTNLSYSIFRNANFNAVDFEGADLSHAVFIGCTFNGANFNHTNMTRAVFIDAGFNKSFTSTASIISRPTISRLFTKEKTSYDQDVIAAIDSNKKVVLYFMNGQTLQRRGELPSLPNNVTIDSPATVVTNNFSIGYSVFLKGSDGFIYEFYKHGNVPGPGQAADFPQKWYKLTDTNICKSNPDATFLNFGGSESANELTNTIACHDKKGTLHTWKRLFRNKPNTPKDSDYSGWTHNTYAMPKTNAEISINRYNKLIYVENQNLIYFDYVNNTKISKHLNTSLQADLWAESDNQLFAYVGTDGNAYSAYFENLPYATNLGAPTHGIISSPVVGSLNTSSEPLRVMVLSGDGKLYAKKVNGTGSWYVVNSPLENTPTSTFKFPNNNLTETYIQNADLSNLNLSSNTFNKTFFTKVKLNKSRFENTTLQDMVFDASRQFNYVSFKSSTLNNVSFTNNRDSDDSNKNGLNLLHVDFTDASINTLIWTNNIAVNTIFDGVTFGDNVIVSKDNRFIGTTIATFKKAKNVPVEFLYQLEKEQLRGYTSEKLRVYDFTSASFSESFYTLNFIDANMSYAKFGSDTNSPRVDFSNIDASGSSWEHADLSFLKCGERKDTGCNFDNTILKNTNLYQAQMNYSSFTSSQWIDTNASSAQFQNNHMDGLIVSVTSNISNTSFNNSSLFQSTLKGLKLNFTSFDNAKLACSDMSGVNFSNSSFDTAILNGSDFSNPISSIISHAIFSTANLSGVNFQNVTFTDSTLKNAIFDFSGNTIFIDEDRQCSGFVQQPKTTSNTKCQDGLKPSTECTLYEGKK